MRIFFLIFLLVYVSGNVYIFIHTLQMLSGFSLAMKILLSVIYQLVAFSLVIAVLARYIDMSVILSKSMFHIDSVWPVFTLYMIFALLTADVMKIFAPSLNYGFYYAPGATCYPFLHGYYNCRHPQVNKINASLDKPIEGSGINIVTMSDAHLGYGTGKAMLKEYIDVINAQHPGPILIGGGLVDNSLTPLYKGSVAEELAQLKAPLGIYMVPGNHEYISGIDEGVRFLEDVPVQLSRDSVVAPPNGVQIIERSNRPNRSRHSLSTLLKQTDRSKPIIPLDHQPYNLAKTDSLGVDL